MSNSKRMMVWDGNAFGLFDDFWSAPAGAGDGAWRPACDIEESQGHYIMTFEVPGLSKDDLSIEVHENRLLVSGERKHESRAKEGTAWYSERRYGRFQRSFELPAGIDADKIEATCQDGILRLLVPKAESAKPRQIKIGSGGFFGKLVGQQKAEQSA